MQQIKFTRILIEDMRLNSYVSVNIAKYFSMSDGKSFHHGKARKKSSGEKKEQKWNKQQVGEIIFMSRFYKPKSATTNRELK